MSVPHDAVRGGTGLLDDAARDELAVKHLDLVARVVGRLPISVPPGLDREDLISAGTLGLLNAARTFQPHRGAAFRTYAYMAIRAAVLDELRRHDPLPRGARARVRALADLETEFRAREGRLPTPAEIGEKLSMDAEHVEDLLGQAAQLRLLRADRGAGADADDEAPPEPEDQAAADPSSEAARHEELERVEDAIRGLAPRERQVVVLYHSEGLYLKEIGALLGVTESRVCQLLAVAQRKIKARVAAAGGAFRGSEE